jgi:hypothetical protein
VGDDRSVAAGLGEIGCPAGGAGEYDVADFRFPLSAGLVTRGRSGVVEVAS